MELEGGRSGSRKRRLAALEPPDAAEAPNPDAGMEDREPPPPGVDGERGGAGGLPGADGGSGDRISELPDGVLEAPNPDAGMQDQEPPLPRVDGERGGAGEQIFQPPDAFRCPVPPPLPGADGGTSKDHISQLPDGVLGDIISLLPTKEGARTQVLASRWRHLWRSAPLNLDHHWLCNDEHALDTVVSRILSTHPGPGRRFCAPVYHLHGERAATADTWLRSPALDNLYELELCSFEHRFRSPTVQPLPYPPPTPLPPPAAAFRFSETLCVATIGNCTLHDSTTQPLHFPKLKKLALVRVSISKYSLHTMIAGCPVLECLLIKNSSGFCCLRINSNSLTSIGCNTLVHHGGLRFGELIIENAPCLERLLQLGAVLPHTSIISAPKLETLGCLFSSSGARLTFGSTVIQRLCVDTLSSELRTVKILSVDMRALSLDTIIKLMRCFPCLERLYIECAGPGQTNVWRRKHRVLLRSFDIRLKKIFWRYYRGIKSHVDFATLFVHNARVLELMTFQVFPLDYNEEYFAQQRKMLQLDSKASRGARFHFTSSYSHGPHRNATDFRVHDLDLADPFERKDPYTFHDLS